MRRIEVTSFALLFLAACHRDGVDADVPSGPAGAALPAPYDAVTVSSAQLLDAYVYLNTTRAHSVTSYNGGGPLEERGATWLFLRWLASQKGESIFGRLVQTSKTGIANIQAQAAESFGAQVTIFRMPP
jgi:hypothetical protein